MRKIFVLVMILIATIAFSGCATILSGTSQKVNVVSEGKKNVKFEIDDTIYKTPVIITLKRKNKDEIIKVLDPECSQKQILLRKKINPVFFVNLLSGGVFGSTTDFATNAMWEYDENVQITCK